MRSSGWPRAPEASADCTATSSFQSLIPLIYIYLWVHTYMCGTCIWRLGVIPLPLPQPAPPSYGFETESLSEPQEDVLATVAGHQPLATVLCLVIGVCSHAELLRGSWKLSSGPHACTGSLSHGATSPAYTH